ncbi:MAG: SUMF1/EgtB/PvdO family nonheme iron enzyme [Planctomycetes bacterium]|nr:SUMF1/EgtB/PvdO family nonheme iron enzyme [Planctomycetota bacterium]
MAEALELIGKQVLGVQIVRRLARGTWSEVFQGEHMALGRAVVLKVFPPGSEATDEALRRFIANAETLSALEHENLAAYLDAGKHEDAKVIVQHYVDGETLAARLKRQGAMEPALAAVAFRDVARGLEAIHASGLGHGDLKPENVLLSKKGDVRVSDYGIARAVPEAGGAPGTAEYLAPEWTAEPNPPADVYSFGALLYRALTGRPPFEGTGEEVVKAHRAQPAPQVRDLNPAVPDRIANLVARCLDKNPGMRPVASECAFELDLAARELRGEVIPGASAPLPPPSGEEPVVGEAAAPAPQGGSPVWSLPQTPSMESTPPEAQPEAVREVREARERREESKTKKRGPAYVPASPLPNVEKKEAPRAPSGPVMAPLAKPTQSYGGFKPKRVSKVPKAFGFLLLVGAAAGASWWGWKQVEPMLRAQGPAPAPVGGGGEKAPAPPGPIEQARADAKRGRYGPAIKRLEGILKEKEDREAVGALLEVGRKVAEEWKAGVVFVPAGREALGGEGARAWVPSFLIDAREVTMEQYAKFLEHIASKGHDLCHVDEVKGKDHAPPGFRVTAETRNLPVTRVDWWDAWAYAAWARRRLPSEAEWERAATWTPDGPVAYPWGAEWKAGAANVGEGDTSLRVAAGGTFLEDRSACWAEDMAGNLSEWCYDWHATLPAPGVSLEVWWGPTSGKKRVVRGANWGSSKLETSLWRRWEEEPGERSDRIGFRCVMDLKRE